jgi:hypothetical protein
MSLLKKWGRCLILATLQFKIDSPVPWPMISKLPKSLDSFSTLKLFSGLKLIICPPEHANSVPKVGVFEKKFINE